MAVTATARVTLTLQADLAETQTDGTTTRVAVNQTHVDELASGTSADQIDKVYQSSGTITAAGTATFDVSGGLTDRVGATITAVEIVAIFVKNMTETSGVGLQVGAGSNPLLNWIIATGDGVKIGAGGMFYISAPVDGFAVTAATGDVLTLTQVGTAASVDYRIILLGRSA